MKSMRSMKSIALAVGLLVSAAVAAQDPETVRAQYDQIIAHLDSPTYARDVSWEEHLVLSYQIARDRDPTPLEFLVLQLLNAHGALKRSDILAVALREDDQALTWDRCAQSLGKLELEKFRSTPETRDTVKKLDATPRQTVKRALDEIGFNARLDASLKDFPKGEETPAIPDVEYNTYFGFLHAHSHLSLDAVGDPNDAYAFARDQGGLDFFALTDHGLFLAIWPWDRKWDQLVDAAEAAYDPGTYATLWGFEWSNPLLGHINILNTEDFTDTIRTLPLDKLYEWLADRPQGFGSFNHPGDFDFLGREFHHFEPREHAIPQLTGVELWNANSSFDEFYYNGSWESDFSYLDAANLQGWRLGALGAQDNHNREWGTLNQFRTGVLATELTREAIIDACRNRRFYATEDRDLVLDFRSNGFPMGARLEGQPRTFQVTAQDRSGDEFAQVRLYRNGRQIDSTDVAGNAVEAAFADKDFAGPAYYYVIVTQTDDNDQNGRNDEAISSPIWFGQIPLPPKTGCGTTTNGLPVRSNLIVVLLTLTLLLSPKFPPNRSSNK